MPYLKQQFETNFLVEHNPKDILVLRTLRAYHWLQVGHLNWYGVAHTTQEHKGLSDRGKEPYNTKVIPILVSSSFCNAAMCPSAKSTT